MGWFWSTPPPPAKPLAAEQQRPPPNPTPQSDVDNDPELQKFIALFQEELRGPRHAQAEPQPKPADLEPEPSTKTTTSSSFSSWWPRSSSSSSSSTSNTSSSSSRQQQQQQQQKRQTAVSISQTSTTSQTSSAPATTYQHNHHDHQRSQGAEVLSESILPTTMSCRQAFDLAWGCQSMVGQWNSVYRYGTVRNCSEQWADFWFCMRTKSFAREPREAAIREHYRDKEARKYAGRPSSEDVWRSRDEKVEPGSAFSATYEDADMTDAEQLADDMERRRRIREQLGYTAVPSSSSSSS